MGGEAEELVAAVRARLDGTPYRLERTARGFDVGVDLADATWWSLMQRRHLERTFTYRVVLDEERRTLAITDDTFALEWRAGADLRGGVPVPTLGARLSRAMGRLETKSFQRTWGVRDDGSVGKIVDYTFDSGEGRELIREPARALGWTERAGTAQRIGVVMGVVGAVGALVTLVTLVALMLLGR